MLKLGFVSALRLRCATTSLTNFVNELCQQYWLLRSTEKVRMEADG